MCCKRFIFPDFSRSFQAVTQRMFPVSLLSHVDSPGTKMVFFNKQSLIHFLGGGILNIFKYNLNEKTF